MDKKIALEERRRHAEENDISWNLHGLRETAMYSIVACSLCFVSHRARGLARARHLGTNDRTREFYGRMFFWHGRKHCLLRPDSISQMEAVARLYVNRDRTSIICMMEMSDPTAYCYSVVHSCLPQHESTTHVQQVVFMEFHA